MARFRVIEKECTCNVLLVNAALGGLREIFALITTAKIGESLFWRRYGAKLLQE